MKIHIETDVCTGHGRCYVVAPQLFDADDVGYGIVRVADVPDDQHELARLAAANCPENAIRVVE